MREPLRSLEILVLLFGVFWVVWGIVGLMQTFGAEPGLRMATFLDGAVTLGLGVLLLAWPEITVRAFMLVIGIFLIVLALVQFFVAYQRRKTEVEVAALV
jgi:uncharacterized membrane protein HdeD (DUF308 family)